MAAISTRTHGVADYVLSPLLIAAPWLLGFMEGGAAYWTLMAAGVSSILLGLFTDFELGLVRRVQMPLHLWIDGVLGILLAISPWLLEFDERVWIPHVAAGVLLIVLAFFTDTIPGYERRGAAR